jgi:hypothetical protein
MVNVYPTLAASQKAEREYLKQLNAMGFWKWVANEGDFTLVSRRQIEDQQHEADRKREELHRKREKPMILVRAIAAIEVVYGVPQEDLVRVSLKTDKLSDARDHLCWLMHGKIDLIHLRRLFSAHHTTISNWRQRFSPGRSASEVRRVADLINGDLT